MNRSEFSSVIGNGHAEYTTGLLNDAMNLWPVPCNGHEFGIGLGWEQISETYRPLVIREGMKQAGGRGDEIAIGSFALTRTILSHLFDTSSNDPLIFAAIAVYR